MAKTNKNFSSIEEIEEYNGLIEVTGNHHKIYYSEDDNTEYENRFYLVLNGHITHIDNLYTHLENITTPNPNRYSEYIRVNNIMEDNYLKSVIAYNDDNNENEIIREKNFTITSKNYFDFIYISKKIRPEYHTIPETGMGWHSRSGYTGISFDYLVPIGYNSKTKMIKLLSKHMQTYEVKITELFIIPDKDNVNGVYGKTFINEYNRDIKLRINVNGLLYADKTIYFKKPVIETKFKPDDIYANIYCIQTKKSGIVVHAIMTQYGFLELNKKVIEVDGKPEEIIITAIPTDITTKYYSTLVKTYSAANADENNTIKIIKCKSPIDLVMLLR